MCVEFRSASYVDTSEESSSDEDVRQASGTSNGVTSSSATQRKSNS